MLWKVLGERCGGSQPKGDGDVRLPTQPGVLERESRDVVEVHTFGPGEFQSRGTECFTSAVTPVRTTECLDYIPSSRLSGFLLVL